MHPFSLHSSAISRTPQDVARYKSNQIVKQKNEKVDLQKPIAPATFNVRTELSSPVSADFGDKSSCPDNSEADSDQCKCVKGYTVSNNKCVPIVCPAHATLRNGECECEKGHEVDAAGKKCVRVDCGEHASFYEASDDCRCDPGYLVDTATNTCNQVQCPDNSTYSTHDKTCACKAGFKIDAKGTSCVSLCSDISHSEYSAQYQSCVCADGYKLNKTQTGCVEMCLDIDNSKYDEAVQECVCKDGYAMNLSQTGCIKVSKWLQTSASASSLYNEPVRAPTPPPTDPAAKAKKAREFVLNLITNHGWEIAISLVAEGVLKRLVAGAMVKCGIELRFLDTKFLAKMGKSLSEFGLKIATKGGKESVEIATDSAAKTAYQSASALVGKAVLKTTERIADKAAAEAAAKVGSKNGTARATDSALGPAGVIVLAAQAASMLVDIFDPSGYTNITASSVNTNMRNILLATYSEGSAKMGTTFPQLLSPAEAFPTQYASVFNNSYMNEVLPKLDAFIIVDRLSPSEKIALATALHDKTTLPIVFTDALSDAADTYIAANYAARDAYVYANLKAALKATNQDDQLQMYDSFSSATVSGVSLSEKGAITWNEKSKASWFQHYSMFKKQKSDPSYVAPTCACYTDTMYKIDPKNPGSSKKPNIVSYMIDDGKYACLGLPLGMVFSFCENICHGGIVKVPPVDPAKFGVTFDMRTMTCNYTHKYCTQMGLNFTCDGTQVADGVGGQVCEGTPGISNCTESAGKSASEFIFGATVTRGIIRGVKALGCDFGCTGCRSSDTGELMHPQLADMTCCDWTADCNNPNSCMYCSPCKGNSATWMGSTRAGKVWNGKKNTMFGGACQTGRVCGKIPK